MEPDDVKFMDHVAIASKKTLVEFCAVAQHALRLPDFRFDGENETEWAISVKDGIEYNISRPYEAGTLQSWDSTVPHGCNFGLILIFPNSAAETPETSQPIVREVCEALAEALGTPLYYHRTWLSPGNSLPRSVVFGRGVQRIPASDANDRETKCCDECESEYFAETSQMAKLCPECAHRLYGYPPCDHVFHVGRCSKCGWDGSVSEYLSALRLQGGDHEGR